IAWELNKQPLDRVKSIDNNNLLLDVDDNDNPLLTKAFQQGHFSASQVYFAKIPLNFQTIKKENIELATKWRLKTRRVFTRLFSDGYQATDIIFNDDHTWGYYVLRKDIVK